MAYTSTFSMALGASRAGLTLAAQILDTDGNDVGSEVTAGFVEIGTGTYILTISIPDDHRGAIKVYEQGAPATILAIASINPEELEPSSSFAFPSGAVEYEYTLLDNLANPVSQADIWITTDVAGANVVWRGNTDIFGVARDVYDNKPHLDPGTYYIWAQKTGYVPSAYPDVEDVSLS